MSWFVPFASQVAIEFPYVFAQSVIYCSIFYSMASFEWTALKFVWYIFFMYSTLLYFTFYGMMTTAVTPNHNVAAIIAAPFYMLWNLFSGFMIPHKVIKQLLSSLFISPNLLCVLVFCLAPIVLFLLYLYPAFSWTIFRCGYEISNI